MSLAVLCAACGTRGESADDRTVAARRAEREPLPPVSDVSAPRVVVLGDSLTAGLGLSMKDAYPTVLQDLIKDVLTPHQQRVLVALAVNGVPIDVLAERLSTTRGALYKSLHDARRKLRKHLTESGLALDGWIEEEIDQ